MFLTRGGFAPRLPKRQSHKQSFLTTSCFAGGMQRDDVQVALDDEGLALIKGGGVAHKCT